MLQNIKDPIIRQDFEAGFKELFTYQCVGNGYARVIAALTKANGKAYSVVLKTHCVGGAQCEIIGSASELSYEKVRELARLNPESDYSLRVEPNKCEGLNAQTWKDYVD